MRNLGIFLMILTALSAFMVAGCGTDDPGVVTLDPVEYEGDGYFAHYTAIGNSLTAGYMDAGLMIAGQSGSFPALIAGQLGIGDFVQPLIASPGIGSTDTGDPATVAGVLHWDGSSITLLGTTPLADVQSQLLLAVLNPTPYGNMGVPGATTLDVTGALDSSTSQSPGNSYFDFILRNPNMGNLDMLEQAVNQGPSLVTVWIGNNDILGGATGGDPVVGVNITPPATFAAMFENVIAGVYAGVLAKNGGLPLVLVANIPDIAQIPYFMPKALFDQVATEGMGSIPTIEDNVQMVLFPALSYLAGGGLPPLPSKYTLTAAEAAAVSAAVDGYNDAIAQTAAAHGARVVDTKQLLIDIQDGDYAPLSGSHFIIDTNTMLSLDGIHPNNPGYGLVANAFIAEINAALESELAEPVPSVDVGGLAWDPTYGAGAGKAADAAGPLVTPEAAAAMGAIFR